MRGRWSEDDTWHPHVRSTPMASAKTSEGLYEIDSNQKLRVKQPIWKSLFPSNDAK